MSLKFGTNTISTSGNYAKFGTTNLTYVKFGSTTVWTKSTGTTYTVTLSKDANAYGSWNKSSITGVASGTSISYSITSDGKATLTVGTQTAVFTPTYIDEFNNYITDYLTNASGSVTSNKTVTAYTKLNPNITVYEEIIDVDRQFQTEQEFQLDNTPNKIRVFFDILGINSGGIEDEIDNNYIDIEEGHSEYVFSNDYTGSWSYGMLNVEFGLLGDTLYITVNYGLPGGDGETVIETYEIRAI